MVLIELFILKLALEGISQEINEEARMRELRQKERHFKSQLSQLAIDYTTGTIDKETYDKRESDIKSELDKMSKQLHV
jgi:lambda family phage tail tape measure protein